MWHCVKTKKLNDGLVRPQQLFLQIPPPKFGLRFLPTSYYKPGKANVFPPGDTKPGVVAGALSSVAYKKRTEPYPWAQFCDTVSATWLCSILSAASYPTESISEAERYVYPILLTGFGGFSIFVCFFLGGSVLFISTLFYCRPLMGGKVCGVITPCVFQFPG